MSEHNAVKPRVCKICNKSLMMTAKELKDHAVNCDRFNPYRQIANAVRESEEEALRFRKSA